MDRIYHEEEQRFTNLPWVWISMLAFLIIPLFFIINDPAVTDDDFDKILLSIGLGIIPIVGILYFSRLKVRIDTAGIHYNFFPAVIKWKTISANTIESFEVSEKKNLLEKLECGHKQNLLNNTISMNITGKKFARIKLRDGRKLKIGSENPEGFERALKKIMSPDNHT